MARPRTNIQDRIVRAARHEFLEHGVKATPLRAIARRARTNLGMIYYYFPTKEDLFLAVIEEPYAKIVESIGAVLAGTEPVRDRLRNLFRRIGAATPDEAETFRLVISEGLKSPELRSKLFARVWRGHLPIVFRALEDGKRDGVLDPSVPTPLLGIVTAAVAVIPQAAARSVPLGLVANDALADRLVELVLRGVGAPVAGEPMSGAVAVPRVMATPSATEAPPAASSSPVGPALAAIPPATPARAAKARAPQAGPATIVRPPQAGPARAANARTPQSTSARAAQSRAPQSPPPRTRPAKFRALKSRTAKAPR